MVDYAAAAVGYTVAVDGAAAAQRAFNATILEMLTETVRGALAPGDTLEDLRFDRVGDECHATVIFTRAGVRHTVRGFGEDALTATDALVRALG